MQRWIVGISLWSGGIEGIHVGRVQSRSGFPSFHKVGIGNKSTPKSDEITFARGEIVFGPFWIITS